GADPGEAAAVAGGGRLPVRKIVISTWLSDVTRERFASEAETLVTPVDPALFPAVPVTVQTSRPRVLMLHHEYAWKGTADGFAAVARVKGRIPALHLVGFGVSAPRGPAAHDEFHTNPPPKRLAGASSGSAVHRSP